MPRLPMPRPVPTLRGDIVTLRPIDPQHDAEDYYRWNLEPQMHVWTGNDVLASVEQAKQELKRFAGMDEFTMWAVIENVSREMIGRFFICLEQRDDQLVAGEGNRIAKPYWRKGHNRQARRLVMEYVFTTLAADCIETECWIENTNSVQSIKSHGFTLAHESLAYNSKHRQPMKKGIFQMTRQQWKHSQAGGISQS